MIKRLEKISVVKNPTQSLASVNTPLVIPNGWTCE